MTLPDTITRTLATDSRFSLMAQALRAAGLDTVLAGKGPFTVCVPTDEAFRVLPPATLAALMADPQGSCSGSSSTISSLATSRAAR